MIQDGLPYPLPEEREQREAGTPLRVD
jgi:hypothetical protein